MIPRTLLDSASSTQNSAGLLAKLPSLAGIALSGASRKRLTTTRYQSDDARSLPTAAHIQPALHSALLSSFSPLTSTVPSSSVLLNGSRLLSPRFFTSSVISRQRNRDTSSPTGGLAADMLKQRVGTQQSESRETTEEGSSNQQPRDAPPPPSEEPKGSALVAWAYILSVFGGGLVLIGGWPGKEDSWTDAGGWFTRTGATLKGWKSYFTDPISPSLLPDPLPEPYGRPYTLVINLNDTLLHLEWTAEHGWRAAKRPGVEYFLSYMSQFYEVVVFTTSQPHNAQPLLDKLDPYGYIMYRLYRDSTKYVDGVHQKDLSHLNRDLKKVIAIDVDERAIKLQRDNAIIVPKWDGSTVDDGLLKLIPFLEMLALSGVEDVRPVLHSYIGKDVPAEFARWQKKLRDDYDRKRREELERTQAANASNPVARVTQGLFGRGRGMLEQQPAILTDNVDPVLGPTPFDIMDAQTRAMRETFLKDQENFKKLAEEQRKQQIEEIEKQMREMKEKKMSMLEWFGMQSAGAAAPEPAVAK
ncbi:mitochondrial inner membrane protein required for protein import [Gonapodya sp. JEL0774]|nr:mitochondrial inner membrane protein required for protein import [Gonapodya sp. JEL0774]